MHNVKKYAKCTLKILQCKHLKIFKIHLVIFQHYACTGENEEAGRFDMIKPAYGIFTIFAMSNEHRCQIYTLLFT